ncbi:MAG: YlxR family protein [Eggerthellaceae bacterium]|nr:YlxR family protein [Eggerthellaceae bacterium]
MQIAKREALRSLNKIRTCIGCGTKAAKDGMVRIFRDSGSVSLDASGKGPGRGAYACSIECLEKACSKGRVSQALRCRVDERTYGRLIAIAAKAFGDEGCKEF